MLSRLQKKSRTYFDASLFLLVALAFAAWEAFATSEPNTVAISFDKVRQVQLGSTQEKAENLFGSPSKIYREKSLGYITWVYIQGSDANDQLQKLSLTFSSSDLRLAAISYFPEPPDAVAFFDGLKKEYPKAKFKTVTASSCGEHFPLNEGFDYDLSSGIRIQKDSAGRVTDLHLSLPVSEQKRKTASGPTGCPDKTKRRAEFIEITPELK